MANSLSISAELTYIRFRGLLPFFQQAANRYKVPLVLLLAVASRESRMGLAITDTGTGDNGYGIGIMQIDKRYHPNFTDVHSPFDHQANIDYGAKFLADLLDDFGGNTRNAVAAYNAGAGRVRSAVRSGINPDHVTTGLDYASDVSNRAELIEQLLPVSKATSTMTLAIPVGLILLGTYNYFTEQ